MKVHDSPVDEILVILIDAGTVLGCRPVSFVLWTTFLICYADEKCFSELFKIAVTLPIMTFYYT